MMAVAVLSSLLATFNLAATETENHKLPVLPTPGKIVVDGKTDDRELLKHLAEADDEYVGRIIKTFFKSDTMYYNQALIIPNQGAVPNLPADAVVEVPGISNRTGAYPVVVGPLPEAPAELVRRQLVIGKLHVDAAATGSRRVLDQAILLDPTIGNIDSAMAFLDDTLTEAGSLYPKLV